MAAGCGDSERRGVEDDPERSGTSSRDVCATPNVGCDCREPSRVVECGQVQRQAGGQVWCSIGHRTCDSEGKWTDCEIEELRVLSAPERGQATQALGNAMACADNPCDPFCQQVVDSGSDLKLPPGLQGTADGAVTLPLKDSTIDDTTCTGIELVPAEQTLTVSSLTGGSPGLLGEYFNRRFGDDAIPGDAAVTGSRLDASVDFDWGNEPPGVAGVGPNTFSVRWTGWIKPAVTRSYQLCTVSDDGARLWLGGKPIIDSWIDQGMVEHCANEPYGTLEAGKLYAVRMELYENSGVAGAQLRWKHAGAPSGEIVPSSVLLPPGAESQASTLSVDPPVAKLTVRALPEGCLDGAVPAAWSVDRLDRATVDNAGQVSLLSAIAGDIQATAYAGSFSAVGTIHVNVNVTDAAKAPAGAAEKFKEAPSGTDAMAVLYPYADTVFPLALRAPVIQWDTGGTAASAVKVSLRYPATGTAQFSWSKIMAEPQPARYALPQEVWSRFEQTAKGKAAAFSVQRITGGVPRPAATRRIVLANAPVRGKIYYTQYARSGATNMMVADPGSSASATSVFANDAGSPEGRRCPVCHSVSANGAMFATSDKRFSANGGLSKINADGSFALLSDYDGSSSPYRDGADDWRGFAWAPLTPDGKYALAANNIWGNSKQQVVGIDAGSREVSVPDSYLSGGSGTGLLAKYYSNAGFAGWDWRRVDPTVDYDWGTGTPGGPLTGAFSVAWSGQVQAFTTETHTFHVETSGGVRLSVGGKLLINQLAHVNNAGTDTFSGSTDLVRGDKTPLLLELADTATEAKVRLRWSSPSRGGEPGLIPQTQLYPNDGYHGVLATFYAESNFTQPFITERLESNIDASWGNGGPRPMPSLDDDNWSAVYTGQLQAPATGNLQLCARANDAVVVTLAGVELLNETTSGDSCSTGSLAVTEGSKYDLRVAYREYTGNASLSLGWQMSGATTFAREIIPSARLTPPSTWSPPTHGLSVTYYDTDDFNASLGGDQTSARAVTRIEPDVNLSWGNHRPEHSSAITDSDTFSARFTGRLEAPCSGLFELELFGDDGGRLWVDDVRISQRWSYGAQPSAIWLDEGLHDLKLEYREDYESAGVVLRWKAACMKVNELTPIPSARFYPAGDAGHAGYVRGGGDNGNDSGYFVWQTPAAAGSAPVDVTGDSAGRWGLGSTVMMVPSFAPDASKLVFIDGDSAAGNGWRKGVSTFEFDQVAKVFKNRRTIVSTWPSGDVMKWPVFESDSRSVIYQATVPADLCCRKQDWTKYGYMGPTNYFEDPGRLFSVDTDAADPRPVELTTLNRGERAFDRNKAYQATMLPQASGGYRWAVFTSTRPYGNTLNLQAQQDYSNTGAYTPMTDYAKVQSMLWVSAIDDEPSGAADRSHPAFFLPSQNFSGNAGSGFLNERAYWVTEACRPAGNGDQSACDVDEDCCAGAVCRIDTPATVPTTRHCFQVPAPGKCAMNGSACVSSADCCKGSVCDDGVCAKPPTLARYSPANFERIYESTCVMGEKVDWTFFDYKASVPAVDGALEIYAESADEIADFHALPVAPSAVKIDGVARIVTERSPGEPTKWTRITLDEPLGKAGVVERKYLKITIRFVPNQSRTAAPILSDWRQSFSCPPGE